jgi:HEAT repeat protein
MPAENRGRFSRDRHRARALVVAALAVAAIAVGDERVTTATLERQLQEGDAAAVDTARQLGAAALPTLLAHAGAESPHERVLVIECLEDLANEQGLPAVVKALDDPETDVRTAAVRALKQLPLKQAVPRLTELITASQDSFVRGGTARALGRAGAVESLRAILAQRDRESDELARHDMTLAAARLGDENSRRGVFDRLADADARNRYDAIGDFEYLGDRSQLARLVPLLNDRARVANVGVEQFPVWHRVCDRAVEAVVAIGGRPLSFPTGGRVYSDAQLAEAQRALPR